MEIRDELDELLYKYMPVADEELICELENQVDKEYIFSDAFEKKMERFLRRKKYYTKMHGIEKYIRSTAAILAVALALSMPFSQSVRAYSGGIIERMKTMLEDSFLYTYFVSGTADEVLLKAPSYLPEGFACLNEMENDTMYYAVYEDELGNQITYQQMLVTDGMQMAMDTEYVSEETRKLNGRDFTLWLYEDGFIHACYMGEQYVFEITAEGTGKEDIFRMMEDTVNDVER